MNITFDNLEALWLVIAIPLLIAAHYIFLKRSQTKALRFANFSALKRISGEKFLTKNTGLLFLRIAIVVLFILAISNSTVWIQGEKNTFDYVIAIDTSSSMLTKDFEPNRLEYAKDAANLFVDSIATDTKIGIVSFSGITIIEEPLTQIDPIFKERITNLTVTRQSGTGIGGAIITSVNVLSNSEEAKAILIFTDGSNTVGESLDDDVKQAVEYAIKNEVIIHAVGIGSEGAPIGYLPEIYNISSQFNEDTLLYITNQTGGKYINAMDENLRNEFQSFNNETFKANIPYKLTNYSLILILILLSIEWILINLRYRKVA